MSEKPSSTRRQLAYLVLGSVLLVSACLPIAVELTADQHRHVVSETAEAPIEPGSPNYYRYEELSPEARNVFREALDADAPVYTAGPVAPELEYPSGSAFELYIVEYENATYVFETGVDPPVPPGIGSWVLLGGLAGVVLLVAGGYPLVRERRSG